MQREVQSQNIPGASVGVVRHGKLIKSAGYGFSNLELGTKAQPETVYQLASMTKQFTAVAVMVLNEEGRLGLDDSISKYLADAPKSWSQISIRNLLTMTSEIKDYNSLLGDSREDFTADRIYRAVAAFPLEFTPGEKWSYSNSNYVMLGLLIQKVCGKSWDTFLAERVFRPLGMGATRRDVSSDIISGRAALYEKRGAQLINCRYVNPTLFDNGDGGLLSTVLDLAKWDAALAPGKLLKRESLEQMFSPVRFHGKVVYHYGFGWFLNEAPGHRIVLHGGGRPGTSTQISRFIDDDLTVIVLVNSSEVNAERLAHEIARIFLPDLPAYDFFGPHPIQHLIHWSEKGELVPLR